MPECPTIIVTNGAVDYDSDPIVNGVTATVTCEEGYALVGNVTTCGEDGSWIEAIPYCKSKNMSHQCQTASI